MKPETLIAPHVPWGIRLLPAAWLFGAVAIPAFGMLFGLERGASPADDVAAGEGPLILDRAEQTLADHRARMQAWLDSYGWVDREAGIARVPIEEGLRMVLESGLPARAVPGLPQEQEQ